VDGALSVRPLVIGSQEKDLLRAPFPKCVPFCPNSNTAIVAIPRKRQQQTVLASRGSICSERFISQERIFGDNHDFQRHKPCLSGWFFHEYGLKSDPLNKHTPEAPQGRECLAKRYPKCERRWTKTKVSALLARRGTSSREAPHYTQRIEEFFGRLQHSETKKVHRRTKTNPTPGSWEIEKSALRMSQGDYR